MGTSDLRALSRASDAQAATVTTAPRPGFRWLTRAALPTVIVLATAGILAYAARETWRPVVEVRVEPVDPRDAGGGGSVDAGGDGGASDAVAGVEAPGGVIAQAPGWVEPSPYASTIPALAEGVVREVLVLEGDSIEAGQTVVRLIDDDARLTVRASEAAVIARQADIERARTAVATAEAQIGVESSALAELKDEADRKRDLVGAHVVAEGTYRRLEIRLEGLEAKVRVAKNVADEARAMQRQAEAALAAAQVALDEAKLRLERMEVKSPVAGVTLARLVEPGSRISMGGASGGEMSSAVMRVYDPTRLQVRADVPLADAAKIGVGTRAVVTCEALPDASLNGTVSRVVHEANIQRNTVQFKVSLEIPPASSLAAQLKPEMLTRVKFHSGGKGAGGAASGGGMAAAEGERLSVAGSGQVLLVPASAVGPGGTGEKGSVVWVLDWASGSPAARQRQVEIAPSDEEGYVAVVRGLMLTDRVIVQPPPSLRDGVRVRVADEGGGMVKR